MTDEELNEKIESGDVPETLQEAIMADLGQVAESSSENDERLYREIGQLQEMGAEPIESRNRFDQMHFFIAQLLKEERAKVPMNQHKGRIEWMARLLEREEIEIVRETDANFGNLGIHTARTLRGIVQQAVLHCKQRLRNADDVDMTALRCYYEHILNCWEAVLVVEGAKEAYAEFLDTPMKGILFDSWARIYAIGRQAMVMDIDGIDLLAKGVVRNEEICWFG